MSWIHARDLLSQLRETELRYFETIRWQKECWIERHLSPSRMRVLDAAIKSCPSEALILDDEHSERGLHDQIDKIAWTFSPVSDDDVRKIHCLFTTVSVMQRAAE